MRTKSINVSKRFISYTGIVLGIIIFTAAAAMAGGPVDVTVDISPKLKASTSADEVVFIFAKAVRGPRAPLAAVKVRVSELPVTVRLDDSKSLMPMLRISNFDEVVLSARISKSGGAMKQSGDLEGVSAAVKTDTAGKPVKIVIDHVVK